jgi:hypothetical protein
MVPRGLSWRERDRRRFSLVVREVLWGGGEFMVVGGMRFMVWKLGNAGGRLLNASSERWRNGLQIEERGALMVVIGWFPAFFRLMMVLGGDITWSLGLG